MQAAIVCDLSSRSFRAASWTDTARRAGVAGQYRLKHVAFVEELWTLKPIARRQDILTSEFDVKRLYRTSPDATYYCIDVWRSIGDACSILTFETGTTLCMNFCVSWYVEPDFWCEIHNIMYETWVRWYEVRSSSMKFTLRMK